MDILDQTKIFLSEGDVNRAVERAWEDLGPVERAILEAGIRRMTEIKGLGETGAKSILAALGIMMSASAGHDVEKVGEG